MAIVIEEHERVCSFVATTFSSREIRIDVVYNIDDKEFRLKLHNHDSHRCVWVALEDCDDPSDSETFDMNIYFDIPEKEAKEIFKQLKQWVQK